MGEMAMIFTNSVVVAVLVVLGLSVARINVVIALVAGALIGGSLGTIVL
jgi:predicted histidine transporter YuiF (NhaC family)